MIGCRKIAIFFLSLFFLFPLASVKAENYNCGCIDADGACGAFDVIDEPACEDLCEPDDGYISKEWLESGGVCGTPIEESAPVDDRTGSSTSTGSTTYTLTPGTSSTDYISPILSVNIPQISFSKILSEGGYIEVNWLSEYISGMYKFLLSISAIFAVLMLMVGGLQYVASPSGSGAAAAKKRITNALTGMVLLFSVYLILYTVNPKLTAFEGLTIKTIDPILFLETSGPEGEGDAASGSSSSVGSYTVNFTLAPRCQTVLEQAANDSSLTCSLPDGFLSPTSGGPSCARGDGATDAHWGNFKGGAKWDYKNFNSSPLDFKATFGTEIKAPFAGKVTYTKGTGGDNTCGNQIKLTFAGTGGYISLCHIKNFEGKDGREVKQGEIIGHAGGKFCKSGSDSIPNTDKWRYKDTMVKNSSGSDPCSDPFNSSEVCDCQTYQQSGQTTGPHVHISWIGVKAGNFLTCLLKGN